VSTIAELVLLHCIRDGHVIVTFADKRIINGNETGYFTREEFFMCAGSTGGSNKIA